MRYLPILLVLIAGIGLSGCEQSPMLSPSDSKQLHGTEPLAMAFFSQDGNYSLLLDDAHSLLIKRHDTDEILLALDRAALPIKPQYVSLSRDNEFLALGTHQSVTLWSVSSQQPIGEWKLGALGSDLKLTALAMGRSQQTIAVGFNTGAIMLLSQLQGETRSLDFHQHQISHLEFSPGDNRLLSASINSQLVVWDMLRQAPMATTKLAFALNHLHTNSTFTSAFVSDGFSKQWLLALPSLKRTEALSYSGRIKFLYKARFDPTDRFLILASAKPEVSVWDISRSTEAIHLDTGRPPEEADLLDIAIADQQFLLLDQSGQLLAWPLNING